MKGDLFFDYYGKGVIVMGNIGDHTSELEAIGGKYRENLHWSLSSAIGQKWNARDGYANGYYFDATHKQAACDYVRMANNTIFDNSDTMIGHRHVGEEVRTIYGGGTVTGRNGGKITVRLQKPTYNYISGLPHIYVEGSESHLFRIS